MLPFEYYNPYVTKQYDVFISHHGKDSKAKVALPLKAKLEQAYEFSVFVDELNLPRGGNAPQNLQQALELCRGGNAPQNLQQALELCKVCKLSSLYCSFQPCFPRHVYVVAIFYVCLTSSACRWR